MKLWKYAILGIIGRAIMIIFFTPGKDELGEYILAGIILVIAVWWGYCDIRNYLAERKLKLEAKEHGDSSTG